MATDARLQVTATARMAQLIAEQQKAKQSIRNLAREYGVSESTVRKAKRQLDRQERAAAKAAKTNRGLSGVVKNLGGNLKNTVMQMGNFGGVASSLGAAGGPIGLAAAAVAALGAASVMAANKMSEFVDQQNRLSASTGLTVPQVLALKNAVAVAGGEFGSAESGLAEFVRRAENARQKGGQAAETFARYGIALETMNGKLRPAGDLLQDTLAALDRIEDPTARAAARTELFGAEAGKALSVLSGEGMDEAIKKTSDLAAATMSAQDESSEMDRAMTDLYTELQTLAVIIGRDVAPNVVAATDALTGAIETGREWLDVIYLVYTALTPAQQAVDLLQKTIYDLIYGTTTARDRLNDLYFTLNRATGMSSAIDPATVGMGKFADEAERAADATDRVAALGGPMVRASPGGGLASFFSSGKNGPATSTGPTAAEREEAARKKMLAEMDRSLQQDLDAEREAARRAQVEAGRAAMQQMESMEQAAHERKMARLEEERNEVLAMQDLHRAVGEAALQAGQQVAGALVGTDPGAQIAVAFAFQAAAAAKAAFEGGIIAGIPAALATIATLAPALRNAQNAASQFDMGGQVAAGAGQPDQGLARVRDGEMIVTPAEADAMRRERQQPQQLVVDHQGYDAMRRSSRRQDALFPRHRRAEVM